MASLSIRGLDSEATRLLKAVARRSGKSVNTQVLELIRRGLGLAAPAVSAPRHTDLDHLAGTWSVAEAEEFEQRTQLFGAIDEDLWR